MVPVLVVFDNDDVNCGAMGVIFTIVFDVEATHGWDQVWCALMVEA